MIGTRRTAHESGRYRVSPHGNPYPTPTGHTDSWCAGVGSRAMDGTQCESRCHVAIY